MSLKRARSKTEPFDANALATEWGDLAKLKDSGFNWLGEDYEKTKRSQGPDRQGLKVYAAPLAKLIRLAPSGFPRHVSLRNALKALDSKHKIKPNGSGSNWADTAAFQWGVMAKHLVDEKRACKGKSTGFQEIDDILASMSDDISTLSTDAVEPLQPPATAAVESLPPPATPVEQLPPPARPTVEPLLKSEDPDSEVEVLGCRCMCAECSKVPEPVKGSDDDSDTSKAADRAPTLEPSKGSQKRAMASAHGRRVAEKKVMRAAGRSDEVKLTKRLTGRKKEAYLHVGKEYWVGCTSKSTPEYLAIIEAIKEAIADGTVTSKEEAVSKKAMLIEEKKLRS